MKQGWEIKQFEDCLEKVVYSKKIQRKDFLEDGEYPIVSQEQDFINGYWDDRSDLFKVKKPVVIFGDHTQVLKFVDFDFVLGADGVKILQPKNDIDPRFFYYFLQNINLGSLGYARHYRLLKEIDVHYPKSLPEQQRIVSILDEAFASIAKAKANAEQNLKNAKELFESYLQGVFSNNEKSWKEKKLEEIAVVKSGGTPSRTKKEYWDGDIAWYSSGELNYLYTQEPERYINDLAINNSNAKIFPKGSLLIGMYDTAALKMSIIDRDAAFNQAISGVEPNDKVDLKFVFHAINLKKQELLGLRRGTRQKNLSLEKIKMISIPLPPIEEQKTIVRQLDALRTETQKLEAIYQKKLLYLEELKKSLLQKAFSGELTQN